MRTGLSTALLLPALLGLAACGADEEADFRVMGSVQVTVSDGVHEPGEAGFNFPTETVLDDDRASQDDGATTGHCELTGAGEAWSLDFALARAGAQDDGLRSYSVVLEDARIGRRAAAVALDVGGTAFKSDASCFAEMTALTPSVGLVTFSLECAGITSESSENLRLASTAALEISGCHVSRPTR